MSVPYPSSSQLWSTAVALFLIPITIAIVPILRILFHAHTSPLRRLPTPPLATTRTTSTGTGGNRIRSLLQGTLPLLRAYDDTSMHRLESWIAACGPTFRIPALLGTPVLFTVDQKALLHVHMKAHATWHKATTQGALETGERLLSGGILFAEGEEHAHQRRIMNPSFGPNQIRALNSLIFDKSRKLRDRLLSTLPPSEKAVRVNIIPWLSKATLDAIGLAGFDYEFNSLDPETAAPSDRELGDTLSSILSRQPVELSPLRQLLSMLPLIRRALRPRPDPVRRRAVSAMHSLGLKFVETKKRAVLESAGSGVDGAKVGADDVQGKDILSLLIKANMAKDIPSDRRLSDEEVLSQIPTFLIAGHETSATATTWTLYALASNPHMQARLRAECLALALTQDESDAGAPPPDSDALDRLPYLDAVVRESLRLYAPVPVVSRRAVRDDVVPLATPYLDTDGVRRDNVVVRKGDRVVLPILLVNRLKDIWGEDAEEFRPERWENLPAKATEVAGVWGNMATFGAGPRACIGFRFAILEIKALLYTLICSMEFAPAFDPADIRHRGRVIQRPHLASEPEKGAQLPLFVRPYRPEA